MSQKQMIIAVVVVVAAYFLFFYKKPGETTVGGDILDGIKPPSTKVPRPTVLADLPASVTDASKQSNVRLLVNVPVVSK